MLAIRLQRTGRSGHAQFRVIVQESRLSPTSGKVVAQLGSYNPHTKVVAIDKDKASLYLEHGAQPSSTVVSLFKKEGIKLPKWVTVASKKDRPIKNPEKLRKNRPAGESSPEKPVTKEAVAGAETSTDQEPAAEAETPAVQDVANEKPATTDEPAAEAEPAAPENVSDEKPETADKPVVDSETTEAPA